jgi:hypothetical protein
MANVLATKDEPGLVQRAWFANRLAVVLTPSRLDDVVVIGGSPGFSESRVSRS